eukprot:1144499-Pelagomonas_calceolata.AAC.7
MHTCTHPRAHAQNRYSGQVGIHCSGKRTGTFAHTPGHDHVPASDIAHGGECGELSSLQGLTHSEMIGVNCSGNKAHPNTINLDLLPLKKMQEAMPKVVSGGGAIYIAHALEPFAQLGLESRLLTLIKPPTLL